MSEPAVCPSSQELAELALQGYECPNADAPMHTAAGCSWCSGSAPYREAVVALAARLQATEQALREFHEDCGCTDPGNPSKCLFSEEPYGPALRALEGAAE